jgi:TolB-like protein/Tfp pilus assembly protein PilF
VAEVEDGVESLNSTEDVTAIAFERPAVAVLPFGNLSNDPEQEYFVDGLTEDIISGLSAWHQFPVIGRNSTFIFKNQAVTAQEVADKLGARYVLEGSVRKDGNRLRISAQLIDAGTGHQVWADRYDRELDDVFELQDEITQRIVALLVPELERAEIERAGSKSPASLDAWDHFLQGLKHFNAYSLKTVPDARACFERALEIDPSYARAKAYLAYTYFREFLLGGSAGRDEASKRLLSFAKEATDMDPSDAECHWILGLAWSSVKNNRNAIAAARRALEINPLHIPAQHTLGIALLHSLRVDEAFPYMERAVRFTPLDPRNKTWSGTLATNYLMKGNYQEAHDQARHAIEAGSEFVETRWLVVSALGYLDKQDDARAAIAELNLPETLSQDLPEIGMRMPNEAITNVVLEGLRKAGVPEE